MYMLCISILYAAKDMPLYLSSLAIATFAVLIAAYCHSKQVILCVKKFPDGLCIIDTPVDAFLEGTSVCVWCSLCQHITQF